LNQKADLKKSPLSQLTGKIYRGRWSFENSTKPGSPGELKSICPGVSDFSQCEDFFISLDPFGIQKRKRRESVLLQPRLQLSDNNLNSTSPSTGELDMSIREILTLASLIEKETSSREERFLISSVFHNRLRIGMPLGCDPTIIYALKKEGKWDGDIRWKDLKMDSPYNTRIHRGLPPGPICSPGIHSIEAALFPENTTYLYFVAKDSKTHYFSKNLKEHNWAVHKYILKKEKN